MNWVIVIWDAVLFMITCVELCYDWDPGCQGMLCVHYGGRFVGSIWSVVGEDGFEG